MNTIRNILIIKGYGKPHPDRWQAYEKRHAERQGLHVAYPEDIPNFAESGERPTIQAFREFILGIIERDGLEPDKTVVLAHSLGGVGWLHLLKERGDLRACLTTFIGTPKENLTGVDEVSNFFPIPSLELTNEERGRILVVGSDNDSDINEHPTVLGAHLSVPSLTIPGAGHFMPRALHQDPTVMDLGEQWMQIRDRIDRSNLPY